MDLAEVEGLLQQAAESEWTTLEVKASLAEKDDAMRTACAFLNGEGGRIIFGVDRTGRIVGTDLTDLNTRNLVDLFHQIRPEVFIQQDRVLLENGKALLVLGIVLAPGEAPHTFQAKPYIRNGARTDVMPQNVYQQRLADRDVSHLHRWETKITPGLTLDDLDLQEIVRTVRLSVAAGRIPEVDAQAPTEETLRKLHVMTADRKLMNAAVALFGKSDPVRFPQMRLHLAHFNGVTKDADILDMVEPIVGNLFSLLDAAEDFLRRRLPTAGKLIPGTIERADEPVFPLKAIREVLANAFAHRDYAHPGGSVHIAIYTDRVEVTNTGGLPAGISVDDLLTEHESKPRNPSIAAVLYKRRLIEQWGRGTRSILTQCRNAGHPDPEFFVRGGSFGVRLRSSVDLGPRMPELPMLKEGELALLIALRQGPAAARDLEKSVPDLALRTLRRYLSNLRDLGLVESEGKRGLGAVWRISEHGLQALSRMDAAQ